MKLGKNLYEILENIRRLSEVILGKFKDISRKFYELLG